MPPTTSPHGRTRTTIDAMSLDSVPAMQVDEEVQKSGVWMVQSRTARAAEGINRTRYLSVPKIRLFGRLDICNSINYNRATVISASTPQSSTTCFILERNKCHVYRSSSIRKPNLLHRFLGSVFCGSKEQLCLPPLELTFLRLLAMKSEIAARFGTIPAGDQDNL